MRVVPVMLVVLVLIPLATSASQTRSEVSRIFSLDRGAKEDSAGVRISILEGLGPDRVLSNLIDIYQQFISTQDKPSCVFQPSCSHYAKNALRKYGVLSGLLLTSDRFERCHRFGKEEYEIDKSTGRFIDLP